MPCVSQCDPIAPPGEGHGILGGHNQMIPVPSYWNACGDRTLPSPGSNRLWRIVGTTAMLKFLGPVQVKQHQTTVRVEFSLLSVRLDHV